MRSAFTFTPGTRSRAPSAALRALTLAALALPGLATAGSTAGDAPAVRLERFELMTSHYREGRREIVTPGLDLNTGGASDPETLDSRLDPIRADSLHARAQVALDDRTRLTLDYAQDTWSGATPIATAPVVARTNTASVITGASPWADPLGLNTQFFVDRNLNLYRSANIFTSAAGARDDRVVHTLSSASPETRKQFDLKLAREGRDSATRLGVGLSHEEDFESLYASAGARFDFNRKTTVLDVGASFTRSDTYAIFDPEPSPFITLLPGEDFVVDAKRHDLGLQIGATRILDKNTVLDFGLSHTRSRGYLANPYKLVTTFDVRAPLSIIESQADPRFRTDSESLRERRPDSREQFGARLGLRRYIERFDAALRLDYQFSRDSWGLRSHALAAEWVQPLGRWTLTPRLRYYSQGAADFYLPFFGTFTVVDAGGNPLDHPLNRAAPTHYSSDHRLSAFGTLSGGLVANLRLAHGVELELGYERYVHAGDLKLGGDGEASFADFKAHTFNAALKLDLDARAETSTSNVSSGHAHHGAPTPAGLMAAHTLGRAGSWSLGYRVMHARQAGDFLLGSKRIDNATLVANGCGGKPCETVPNEMTMTMHMLDIMYAPTDWLTLMAMPQWMDMQMTLTPQDTGSGGSGHGHGEAGGAAHAHQTGGIGDLGLAALVDLIERDGHRLHLGLGFSLPTGDVDIALRKTDSAYSENQVNPTLIHYGMQLGSGTVDFLPSLTYTGERGTHFWGAQLSAVRRLEARNDSNFALGDNLGASLWGGKRLAHWLNASLRLAYLRQDAIDGEFRPPLDAVGKVLEPLHQGPMDRPENYGGSFWDLGLGLDARLAPNVHLGFEWLEPVRTRYNGYQLDRSGAFALQLHLAL